MNIENTNNNHSKPCIIVAEDNFFSQQYLKTVFLQMNISDFYIAANGKELIEALDKQSFNIAFIDIEMPVMNGLEAALKLRKHDNPKIYNMPIVALTCYDIYDDSVFSEEYYSLFNDSLRKPIVIEDIVKIIKKYFPDFQFY